MKHDHEIERLEALCDLHYAAGVAAGWNCENPAERDQIIERRRRPALQKLAEIQEVFAVADGQLWPTYRPEYHEGVKATLAWLFGDGRRPDGQ